MKHHAKGEISHIFLAVRQYISQTLQELNPRKNFSLLRSNVRQDIMAGITVAVIALPLALAFGVGSGLGAMAGLWGAVCGGIIASLLGGSIIGVSGPTGPKMAQLALIMVSYKMADGSPDITFAFTIIFLSGVILVMLSFLRISKIVYYIPYSVIAGFMCGIGVIVILFQLDPFFGSHVEKTIPEIIKTIPNMFEEANVHAIYIAVPALILLFTWPRIIKKITWISYIPSPLAVLILGTAFVEIFHLDVKRIGDIPTGFPDLTLPDFSKYAFGEYLEPALALAGLAIFDSLLTCLVNDKISGDKHSGDRECFAQGVANIGAGLIGGLTTATATMRSIALYESGGRTPLGSFVHGAVLLLIALWLGPVAALIPLPILAAILIKVGLDILDYRILPVLHKLPLSDMLVFWVVFLVTLWEDLLIAVTIGMVLACFRFIQDIAEVYKKAVEAEIISANGKNSHKFEYNDNEVKISLLGPLFFGNIQHLNKIYDSMSGYDRLIIDLKNVSFVDLSGAYALQDIIEAEKSKGKKIKLVNLSEAHKETLERLNILPCADGVIEVAK